MARLSQTSAAVKLLKSKFQSGAVTDAHTPAQVWRSDPLFQQHKLPAFRNSFHRIKKDLGFGSASAEHEVSDDLNRKCTGIEENNTTKRRRLIDEECEESGDDSDTRSFAGVELVAESHSFRPLYLFSERQEPRTMTNRISIAILLPSGVNLGDFHARVVEGGEFVEMVVRPAPLVDPEFLHKKWLISDDDEEHIELYHPKIVGFQTALKGMRKLMSDSVESKVRIPLPFAVQTHIE